MAQQFARFAEEHSIKVTFEDTDMNPSMAHDKWAQTAAHYKVKVVKGSKSMTFHYSKGPALAYGVTPAEALEAIYNDVGSVLPYGEAGDWESWANDLGYEWESGCEKISAARAEEYGMECDGYHKAKKAWSASWKLAKDAERVLGNVTLADLLALDPA